MNVNEKIKEEYLNKVTIETNFLRQERRYCLEKLGECVVENNDMMMDHYKAKIDRLTNQMFLLRDLYSFVEPIEGDLAHLFLFW